MTGRPPLDFRRSADRFDADWYRSAYPDLPAGDADAALAHFVDIGSHEGRQPNPDFAADWYLQHYPRAAAAVAEGRLTGAYHDYLLRRRQELPRLAGPPAVAVGVSLADAGPHGAAIVLRLAARAPGWGFWLLAPPGTLPDGAAGPNVAFVSSPDELPPLDLWLRFGDGPLPAPPDAPPDPAALSLPLGSPVPTPDGLDRTLETLRRRLLAVRPVVPACRTDSGPMHIDGRRVAALRLTVRRHGGDPLGGGPLGGGVVLRDSCGIVAELPPATDEPLAATVDVRGLCDLRMTVSRGLRVDLAPADPPPARPLDLIVTGHGGQGRPAWQRTLESVAAVAAAESLVVVAPPRLALPDGTRTCGSLADALAVARRPALVVPVGVRLFPQAVDDALAGLARDGRSILSFPAIRHPDGHLAPWPQGDRLVDPALFASWERGCVILFSTGGRRRAAGLAAHGRAWRPEPARGVAFAALLPEAWPSRLKVRRDRAPDWLRLDARPDGAVLGRLRLKGRRLAEGGTLILTGRTDGALAAPCRVVVRRPDRPGAGPPDVIGRLTLPAAGSFAWAIELPGGPKASDTIEIVPQGGWQTVQDSPDSRPRLFQLGSVAYRPPPIRPSASSRSR
jgi:hypothetical protein